MEYIQSEVDYHCYWLTLLCSIFLFLTDLLSLHKNTFGPFTAYSSVTWQYRARDVSILIVSIIIVTCVRVFVLSQLQYYLLLWQYLLAIHPLSLLFSNSCALSSLSFFSIKSVSSLLIVPTETHFEQKYFLKGEWVYHQHWICNMEGRIFKIKLMNIVCFSKQNWKSTIKF